MKDGGQNIKESIRRLVELFYPPYFYCSKLGLVLPKLVKLKALLMVLVNSMQFVSSDFSVPRLRRGEGEKNIESMQRLSELFYASIYIKPIQDGRRGQKAPLPVFPPVTSTNLGISLRNFLTFSFNPFYTLV